EYGEVREPIARELVRLAIEYPDDVASKTRAVRSRLSAGDDLRRGTAAVALVRLAATGRYDLEDIPAVDGPDWLSHATSMARAYIEEPETPNSARALAELNDDDRETVRALSILATGRLCRLEGRTPDAAADGLSDPSAIVRVVAARTLYELTDDRPGAVAEVAPALGDALDDSDDEVRELAVKTLRRVAETDPDAISTTVDALAGALEDPRPEIRGAACTALDRTDEMVDRMAALRDDPASVVREAARSALGPATDDSTADRLPDPIPGWPTVRGSPRGTGRVPADWASIDDGKVRWRTDFDGPIAGPVTDDGHLFVATPAGDLIAVAADSGETGWQCELEGNLATAPTAGTDAVYVGSTDGRVYSVAADTGERQWEFIADGAVEGAPVLVENTLFVGDTEGRVYAIDATSGEKQWRTVVDGAVTVTPAVNDGRLFVGGDRITALSASTGDRLWTADRSVSRPLAAISNRVVAGEDTAVVALAADTGEHAWSFATGGSVTAPAIAGGTVYVGSMDHSVYALDAETGSERWRTAASAPILAAPGVAGDRVFVGGVGVLALDAESGDRRWHVEDATVDGLAVGAAGVYGAGDGHLLGIGATDDSLTERFSEVTRRLWSRR
ncbi:MAG: outer membrane protein assembly factor BamB, partial [Halobacteriales archaeon]